MFARGDTFFGPLRINGKTPHLWIVLHCDSDRLLWVNVTTFRDKRDESCILMPGDHPFITQASVVNFREANDPLIKSVQDALAQTYLIKKESCSKTLIEKILAGAQSSPFLKSRFKGLCV